MVSFRNSVLALAAAVAVSADYWIDPSTVPLSLRKSWCQSELSTCPLICQQTEPPTTLVNTCDAEHLTYGCLCGNNLQPNVSEYTLTLPYFVCTEWGTQCEKACGSDSTCAASCRQDHPCGAQKPKTNYTTTSSTMESTAAPTATTTSNQVFDGIPGATTTPTQQAASNNKNSAAAIEFGRGYGLFVVAGSLFAGFAMML